MSSYLLDQLPDVEFETMSWAFQKYHLRGNPTNLILHRFYYPDEGDPHDHPFDIATVILEGGYVEELYEPETGTFVYETHNPGDKFLIPTNKIHRIINLPNGPCLTATIYGPKTQEAGFWKWDQGKAYRRNWNGEWREQ